MFPPLSPAIINGHVEDKMDEMSGCMSRCVAVVSNSTAKGIAIDMDLCSDEELDVWTKWGFMVCMHSTPTKLVHF